MKLKKYSHYKNSGIDWIGEIPEGWEIRKIKNVGNLSTSSVDKKSDPSEKPIKLLNYMDIYSSKDKRITQSIDFMNVTIKPSQYVTSNLIKGDLLFTPSSETADDIGHSAVIMDNLKGVVYSYHILRLRFNNNETIDDEFKRYVFNNHYFLNQLSSKATGTTRMTLGLYAFKDSSFVLPPLQTQQRISSFLDSKTLQIENLIEKDKKLIGFLKERRVSLINKAVTKGLDDSVKMKDSGVEWIGEIPERWEVRKLKNIAVVIMGQSPDGNSVNDDGNGIPFFQGKAEFGNINPIIKNYTIKPTKLVKSNDILLSVRAPVGAINIANIKCCIGRGLAGIRYSNYNYLYYLLKVTKSEFDIYSSGSTFDAISTDNLKSILLPFTPNIQEQQKIVEFLDKETEKIDNHIKKVEKRIELYEEYKKSLIYNVVTGKVEV